MGEKRQNKRSILLNNEENETIMGLHGYKCQALASAVVQLMVALPESRNKWTKQTTGVACFIKDNPKRSYFIRIYDLKLGCISWEQELYTRFKYNCPLPYFHTFAADTYNVGLNFASDEEAALFKQQIFGLLHRNEAKKRKKEEERRNLENQKRKQQSDIVDSGVKVTAAAKKRKKKITKDDIGVPANFKHIEHIGWNPEAGFSLSVDMQDEKWKTLLAEIGVTKQQLQQKSTRKFIYDFVQNEGGIDEFRKKIHQERPQVTPSLPLPSRGPPQTPDRVIPPPPPRRGASQPPPPPIRMTLGHPPPLPSRGFSASSRGHSLAADPPQPPPFPAMLQPAEGSQREVTLLPQVNNSVPPPPPPIKRLPPAPIGGPPPPPPPSIGAPPPPPPIGGVASGAPPPPVSERGNLLMQIQQGRALKSVNEEDKIRSATGDRSDLLSEIHKGTTLKKVSQVDGPKQLTSLDDGGGILGALQLALAKRGSVIHSSDDNSDSETEYDSDEDEWND